MRKLVTNFVYVPTFRRGTCIETGQVVVGEFVRSTMASTTLKTPSGLVYVSPLGVETVSKEEFDRFVGLDTNKLDLSAQPA